VAGRRVDNPQLAVLRLVTAVNHAAVANVCNGVGDPSRNHHHDDGGDGHSNATKTSVHG
jgi:hypothetical protein